VIRQDQPTVLLGFAEAFAAIEAIWSLQRAGMRVMCFARAGRRSAARRMRGVPVFEIPPPETDLPATITAVSALIERFRPEAFLPLDDASLWLTQHVDRGACAVVGPDTAGAAFALNKAAQIVAAARAGLDVPDTTVFTNVHAVTVDRWPVILKPADAVISDGATLVRPRARICANAEELKAAQAVMRDGHVLCQALVTGTGEGLFAFAGSNDAEHWSAHRRVRMLNPHGSASSACESIPVDTYLRNAAWDMLARLEWRGLFMAEFLRDSSGRAFFMEINGRAWGSLALARRRGFEYPAWAVQDALVLPRSPGPADAPPPVRARHLGREIGHLAFVLRGPQTQATVEWPGRWRTLRDLLTIRPGDRLYNWDPRHPAVLTVDTWRTLADLAPRPGRRLA